MDTFITLEMKKNDVLISEYKSNALCYMNENVVKKIATENNIKYEVAIEKFKTLLKFLEFCTKTKYPCLPSKEIDEMWHDFILFTKDYSEFCITYFGKFIHHYPMDGSEKIQEGYFCYIDSLTNEFTAKYINDANNECGDCGGWGCVCKGGSDGCKGVDYP